MSAKSTSDLKIRRVEVDPDQAKRWLKGLSVKNRKLKPRVVNRYANDMAAGRWRENGATIVFNYSGHLIDGQHRLNAIIQSGCTIPLLAVQGVHENRMQTVDIGVGRSLGDILQLEGHANANTLAVAAMQYWKWHNWWSKGFKQKGREHPSKTQLQEVIAQNPRLEASVSRVGQVRKLMSVGVAGWLHYEFCRKDRQWADDFFEKLITGAKLGQKNPIYRLRERLIANRAAPTKLPRLAIIAFCIKSWNAYRTGRGLPVLRWERGREDIPKIA